ALVKADQAAIDLAATQLGYTEIKAPIDGRTGIRMVDEGNVVRASANSAIVVITQVQPISVLFSLPQQELGRINAAVAKSQLSVDVLGPDGKTVLDSGKLQVVDNQVDQTTGTVKLKAEFKNADLQLWPGQFVNVRLLINTLKQVVIVPTAAIQQGPDGTFVFAVADGDKVTIRPVKVGQRDDRETVVAAGLSVGERVVTTGFSRLREGTPVAVSGPEVSAASKGKGKNAAHSGNGKGKGKGRRRSREASGAEASIQAQGGHGGSEAGWRARPRPSGDSTAP
ncbi:MAG: efflux RND transporter periplasmic adaptor subunit, partial [Hyphomicrobiaceae bacterium]